MSLRPIQLLLVEDSQSDILLITAILQEQTLPINVQVAMDGERALQILTDGKFLPDLMILDLNIPKVHGFDVLRRSNVAEMPVIVFSSSENTDDIIRAFELGAREFVHKPSGLNEFRQQVTQIVRNWAPPHLVNAAKIN